MVSFRFHIVSLIAVFLALGLGILVGSTVVDQVIVDRLDREIRSVRNDSSRANAENGALRDELARNEDFLTQAAPYVVNDRLAGEAVVVVAEDGVDPGASRALVETLREAGADVPGVLWLQNSWRLDDEKQLASLLEETGVTGNNATARQEALRSLAGRLIEPAPPDRTADTDPLAALMSNGFVRLAEGDEEQLARFPAGAARVVFVTGTDSTLDGLGILPGFVQELTTNGAPVLVAEVYDDHDLAPPVPERGASLTPVRGDPELSPIVATVDDVELVQGAVATVVALEQLVDGTPGHYGYGQGAQAPLPPVES
jgi:hypothetical protein